MAERSGNHLPEALSEAPELQSQSPARLLSRRMVQQLRMSKVGKQK